MILAGTNGQTMTEISPRRNNKVRLKNATINVKDRTINPTNLEIKLSIFARNLLPNDSSLIDVPTICFQGEKRVLKRVPTEKDLCRVSSLLMALTKTQCQPLVYHQPNIESISIRLLYQSLPEVATSSPPCSRRARILIFSFYLLFSVF